MIQNQSGQRIGAQMVSATDGSAFTGAVTVYVTIDAGVQALGAVGAGVCVHEGLGLHTYAPAQAETNGGLLAFSFIGTGAIPVTVQVFTVAGDAFTRLGAPAGASIAADLVTIDDFLDTEMAAVLTATTVTLDDLVDDLEARLTAALASKLAAHAAGVLTFSVGVGSTTTAVVLSLVEGATPSATNDFYNGAVMIFTSGALAGQRTSISGYNGTTKVATVVAVTSAPASGFIGVIV